MANYASENTGEEYRSNGLRESVAEVKQAAGNLKNCAADLARHVYADGREALSHSGENMRHRLDGVREISRDGLKRVEEQVRAHPGQSLAVAFAVGILASFIIGRR